MYTVYGNSLVSVTHSECIECGKPIYHVYLGVIPPQLINPLKKCAYCFDHGPAISPWRDYEGHTDTLGLFIRKPVYHQTSFEEWLRARHMNIEGWE